MQKVTVRLFSAFFALTALTCPFATSNQLTRTLEITAVDLFAMRNWDSDEVSVLGFKLGMLRSDAIRLARQSGFGLLNSAPPQAGQHCSQSLCSIYSNGRATFVNLVFGEDQRVKEIRMDLFVADGGGVMWIGQHLKGDSKNLAMNYTDELRLELMGREDVHCEGNPTVPRPKVQAFTHTYSYKRRGFVFEIGTVEEGYPTNVRYPVIQVELSFVPPEK